MNALGERIARLIAAQGPISVAQFMTIALHDPQAGYYATHDPIGAGGDFITAPEVSQTFGELLGLWCVECWRQQGSPPNPLLVELGPGRGTLMADALRAASVDREFIDNVDVVLIEASPALRAIQAEMLKPFVAVPVRWLDRFDETLEKQPLFLLANEFFDALPIRQYIFTPTGWCERMVTLDDNDALVFATAPFAQPGLHTPTSRKTPRIGDIYEICLPGTALMEEIAFAIARNGGAALIVDYGYDQSGFGETLQAVAGHRFATILERPGEADISAHVDFSALCTVARQAGCDPRGPVAQNAFLAELGIAPRAAKLAGQNPSAKKAIYEGVLRLLDPAQMGTLFKALAIMPPHLPTPPAF